MKGNNGQVFHDSSLVNRVEETLSSSPSHCKFFMVDSISRIETSLGPGKKNPNETVKGSTTEPSSLL